MIVLLAAVCILGLCLFIVGVAYSRQIQVTLREVPLSGLSDNVQIVLLSDLHETEFGSDYCDLINLVKDQKPDVILLSGDMISRTAVEQDIHRVCLLIAELAGIAPVYQSLGNHETDYIEEHGNGLLEAYTAAGSILLEGEYIDLAVNGSVFRLGGMSKLAYRDGSNQFWPGVEEFLTDYCDTDLPTVLLSHRPEAFSFKDACREWDVNLILSGHTHGGLVRLPVVGGLIAPIQGFFPKVDYGEFVFHNSKMIVTSGLAGYQFLPRVYNRPEICVITLVPENTAER